MEIRIISGAYVDSCKQAGVGVYDDRTLRVERVCAGDVSVLTEAASGHRRSKSLIAYVSQSVSQIKQCKKPTRDPSALMSAATM